MIKNKEVTILGSGISGIGSARLAQKLGIKVFMSDKNSIKKSTKKHLIKNKIAFEENGHDLRRLLNTDEIIISPGSINIVRPIITPINVSIGLAFFGKT